MSKLPIFEKDEVFSELNGQNISMGKVRFNKKWACSVFEPNVHTFFGPIFLKAVAEHLENMDKEQVA